jgi:hypothetical protein
VHEDDIELAHFTNNLIQIFANNKILCWYSNEKSNL